MYSPDFTNQFKKDFKKCKKRGLSESLLQDIVGKILKGEPLPPKNREHKLIGNYADCTECHIKPDWLLIYIIDEDAKRVEFVRTGTHSDLFK